MSMIIAVIFDVLILIWFGSKVEIGYIITEALIKHLNGMSRSNNGSAPMHSRSGKSQKADRMRAA